METGQESRKGMGMSQQHDTAAREREEITSRLATFRATQEKFAREREEYFIATLENARGGFKQRARGGSERPPFWS
jgi:hypothetical protein